MVENHSFSPRLRHFSSLSWLNQFAPLQKRNLLSENLFLLSVSSPSPIDVCTTRSARWFLFRSSLDVRAFDCNSRRTFPSASHLPFAKRDGINLISEMLDFSRAVKVSDERHSYTRHLIRCKLRISYPSYENRDENYTNWSRLELSRVIILILLKTL